MTPEQILSLIQSLTTLSAKKKEEFFDALENETFDDAMNEELISAVEAQQKLWKEESAELEGEYAKKSEELSAYLAQIDTEHKAALREAYLTVKKNIDAAEAEAEGAAEQIIHGTEELDEADAIRAKLGLK